MTFEEDRMKLLIGGATVFAASLTFGIVVLCTPFFNRDSLDAGILDE
jgi:hypothetical protein